jgi:hypothetical protein
MNTRGEVIHNGPYLQESKQVKRYHNINLSA